MEVTQADVEAEVAEHARVAEKINELDAERESLRVELLVRQGRIEALVERVRKQEQAKRDAERCTCVSGAAGERNPECPVHGDEDLIDRQ